MTSAAAHQWQRMMDTRMELAKRLTVKARDLDSPWAWDRMGTNRSKIAASGCTRCSGAAGNGRGRGSGTARAGAVAAKARKIMHMMQLGLTASSRVAA